MKIISGLVLGMVLCGLPSFGQITSTNTNNITGEWNFDAGDLSATVGTNLVFRGNTASVASFETSMIGGELAKVLRLPGLSPAQGLIMFHGAAPNAGGTNVNDYTLLMDVMWPGESDATWRAVLQNNTNNNTDAILFVNPANAIGINNVYEGQISSGAWHRLALVYSITNDTQLVLYKYIDGTLVNPNGQPLGSFAVDGEFSLKPSALLFSDNDSETAPVLINSIQFRSVAMTDEEIAALGGATAGGLSNQPVEREDVVIERIQRMGNEIVLTVSGGGNLQLQKTLNIGMPAWANVGAPMTTNTFRVPATDAYAFFRFERK